MIQGALGGQAYIKTWSGTIGNFLKEYYDNRWTPENPNAKGPRTYERENQYWAGSYEGDHANDFFLRSGDYLRLKNLEIGYAVGEKTLKAIGFSKLRFYMTNRSFLFAVNNEKYIMRIPGEGTDELIDRNEEAEVFREIGRAHV